MLNPSGSATRARIVAANSYGGDEGNPIDHPEIARVGGEVVHDVEKSRAEVRGLRQETAVSGGGQFPDCLPSARNSDRTAERLAERIGLLPQVDRPTFGLPVIQK